jgi:predicted small secreted protein
MLAARLMLVAASTLLTGCAGSDGFYNQGVEKPI